MSKVIDEILLEDMKEQDDADLLEAVSSDAIDTMLCFDEETGICDPDYGMLFPQPVRIID